MPRRRGTWVVPLAIAGAVLAACAGFSGCKPRQAPVEHDRATLCAALRMPAERLRYGGGGDDPWWHYVRYWQILADGQDLAALGLMAKTAGHVQSLHGQVVECRGDRELMVRLGAKRPLPLNEAAARNAARDISRRLWPRAATDWTPAQIKSHLEPLGDIRAPIPGCEVELTFPNPPKDTVRYARFTFLLADGTCEMIWARLWD